MVGVSVTIHGTPNLHCLRMSRVSACRLLGNVSSAIIITSNHYEGRQLPDINFLIVHGVRVCMYILPETQHLIIYNYTCSTVYKCIETLNFLPPKHQFLLILYCLCITDNIYSQSKITHWYGLTIIESHGLSTQLLRRWLWACIILQ